MIRRQIITGFVPRRDAPVDNATTPLRLIITITTLDKPRRRRRQKVRHERCGFKFPQNSIIPTPLLVCRQQA